MYKFTVTLCLAALASHAYWGTAYLVGMAGC